MWVANGGADTVSELRASDGALLGTFHLAVAGPSFLTFDGANVWVTSNTTNESLLSILRASDGALLANIGVLLGANGVAFDGANRWLAGANNMTKF